MRNHRMILGFLALVLLLSLMVYSLQGYESNDPQIKKYKQIFATPDQFNNTNLSFSTEILSVDTTNRTVSAVLQAGSYTSPFVEIHVDAVNVQTLKKGDTIDVIGVFHDTNQITATELWVYHPWDVALLYLRSLLAIPFVFYLFFRTWRWDTATWRFERRKKDA